MSFLSGSQSNTSSTSGDLKNDVELQIIGEDSISDLQFSPTADYLAAASWDKKVRIWAVSEQRQSKPEALIDFEAPALACAWSQDGTKIAGVGADNHIRLLDLQQGGTTPLSWKAHDQPIRCCKFGNINGSPYLITGSWDKKIKYWDLRSDKPTAELDQQDRVYTMDVKDNLLVVGTADRYINVVSLADPTKIYKTIQSPLKFQTRVVSCFKEANGFAVGSIEGRCAIQYVEEKDSSSNFSFKCHRENAPNSKDVSNVYSVNAISFHPEHGTFSTAGSDGTFHFWDGNAKHRLKGYPATGNPITATAFNRQGTIFAYASCYDWSQGYQKNSPQNKPKVMLHQVIQEEVKPRPKAGRR